MATSAQAAAGSVPPVRRNRFERLTPRRQRWLCLGFAVALFLLGEAAARTWNWARARTLTMTDLALYRATIVDPALLAEQDGSRFIRFDPLGGYRLAPYQGRSVHVNALGLRGREVQVTKRADTLRVLMLGGSTTFGFGATSDDTTIPANLERILRQRLGFPVEVLNAGVPGYDSAQEMAQLQQRWLRLRPDLVIIYDGANDLYDSTLPDWAPNRTPTTARLERQVAFDFTGGAGSAPAPWGSFANAGLRLVGDVAGHSALVTKLAALGQRLAGALGGRPDAYRCNPAGIDVWVANVRTMVTLARANDAHVLVALNPVIGVVDKPLTQQEQAIALIDEQSGNLVPVRNAMFVDASLAMARAAARDGFPFVDLNQRLGAARATLFFDSYHLLDVGNAAVAEQLARAVLEAGLAG